jgi:hypothetical protein
MIAEHPETRTSLNKVKELEGNIRDVGTLIHDAVAKANVIGL